MAKLRSLNLQQLDSAWVYTGQLLIDENILGILVYMFQRIISTISKDTIFKIL